MLRRSRNSCEGPLAEKNRAKEKGRYWLPSNSWLKGRLQVYTNQGGFNNCNAYWDGKINLYQSQKSKP